MTFERSVRVGAGLGGVVVGTASMAGHYMSYVDVLVTLALAVPSGMALGGVTAMFVCTICDSVWSRSAHFRESLALSRRIRRIDKAIKAAQNDESAPSSKAEGAS